MREIVLEADAVKFAEAHGWYQRKMQFVGVKGCPDRWFFRAGRLLIVEFKKLHGELDGHQVRRKRELEAAGWEVHVIDKLSDFEALIHSAEAEIASA